MNTPYFTRYRHGEFLQYLVDVLTIVDKEDLNALLLQPQRDQLQTLTDQIDDLFNRSQASAITQQLIALDDRRDRAIVGIRAYIESYQYHFDPALVTASTALRNDLNRHGNNIPRLSYQEETIVLSKIIEDWSTTTELTNAVTALNLGNWITELQDANTAFAESYIDRVTETSANPTTTIIGLRIEAITAYRALLAHIQAHATLGTNAIYDELDNQISTLAGQYNQVVDNRTTTPTSAEDDPQT